MNRSLPMILCALVAAPAAGCVSYWKGQEMQADLVALQGQFESAREDQKAARKKFTEQLGGLVTKMKEIEAGFQAAIVSLQEGSADSAQVIEALRQKTAVLEGQLAEAKHNLEQAANGLTPIPATPGAPPLPEDVHELYRYGYDRQNANDCPEAERAFTTFAAKFPEHDRADNSLFLLARCQFNRSLYTDSIRTLQLITKKYAKGDKVDDALELMHDNFVAMGRCKDALPFLETLIADYPQSSRVKAARKKLKAAKRGCR